MTTMDDLAYQAWALRPRLFAVYGILRGRKGLYEEMPYVGWGMDLDSDRRALYWDAPENSVHYSNSAEQVLHGHRRIGVAHLVWLDEAS